MWHTRAISLHSTTTTPSNQQAAVYLIFLVFNLIVSLLTKIPYNRQQPVVALPHHRPFPRTHLSLIRLRFPPLSNIGCELGDNFLIRTSEQDSRWLGSVCGDALGHWQLHRMSVLDLEIDELPDLGALLDAGPVTDSDQPQDGDVAFRHSGDVILQHRTHGAPLLALWTIQRVLRRHRDFVRGRVYIDGDEVGNPK